MIADDIPQPRVLRPSLKKGQVLRTMRSVVVIVSVRSEFAWIPSLQD